MLAGLDEAERATTLFVLQSMVASLRGGHPPDDS